MSTKRWLLLTALVVLFSVLVAQTSDVASQPDERAYDADTDSQSAEVPIDGEHYRVSRTDGAKSNTA